ncbi:Histone-lysine N-methyltransferase SETMAR, partial [Habropoda laboriosa]
CTSLFMLNQKDPFFRRIVSCDEKWMLYDNRQRRSAQWIYITEAAKRKPKLSLNPRKVMVTG